MKAHLPNILIVDDDDRLRALIHKYLVDNGFVVVTAASAEAARVAMSHMTFNLVILDVMMPVETGFEFLEKLRKTSQTPVLMLTAQGEPSERIEGLEAGADDYLTKPFEPKELVLRIKSILKRGQPKKLEIQGLTSGEEALLNILAENMGQTISRETLAQKLGNPNERAVDVQVTRLRKKLEDMGNKQVYIQTVRGSGYRLNN